MSDTEASKKPAEDSKIMDVAKPGKTAPDASSRPVIVSQRPIVKDPMMSADKEAGSDVPEKDKETTASRVGMTIEPTDEAKALAGEKQAKEAAEPKSADNKSEPKAETEAVEVKVNKAAEAPKQDEAKPNQLPETDSAEDEPDEAGQKKESTAASPEELAKQAALENLIESKQYFVPISSVKSRAVTRVVMVTLVVLLLLAVGVELAIDAGLIDIGIPPVVDLIKN